MDFREEGLRLYYHNTLKTLQTNTVTRSENTAKAVVDYAVSSYRIELQEDDLVEELLEILDVPEWVAQQWCEQTGPVRVACSQTTVKETPFRSNEPRYEDLQPKPPLFEVRCRLHPEQRRTEALRNYIHELGRETHHGTSPPQGETPLQKFTERTDDRIRVCPLQTAVGTLTPITRGHHHVFRHSSAPIATAHHQKDIRTAVPPRHLTSLTMSVVSVQVDGTTFNMNG